ncbi:hypothetical protein SLEP1_g6063 [Rubroshorea leprosula]|uniref:GAG-pre-integrase domain-containing protein n=1 Tax=Rubroshorea leprosula TaxID=152421 RepID=A0AAV5I4L8_9ROSI|nr:hypothetical protein SLEP1_g6063 [Rubroshorea leprosula]
MKAILSAHDLWEIVESGYAASQDITLDEVNFEKVSNATTAKQLWEKLQAAYKGKEQAKKVRLQSLRGEFEAVQMKETEKVSDHISRVMGIANQVRRLDEKVTDLKIIEKILRLVTEKFDYVVTAIEESKDLEDMIVKELSDSLEAHEEKLNRRKKESLEQVLQSTLSLNDKEQKGGASQGGQGRGRGCGRGQGLGRGGRSAENINQNEDKKVNEEVETTLWLAYTKMKNEEKHSWYLDTEANNRMCGNKEVLVKLDEKVSGTSTFGDSSKIPVRDSSWLWHLRFGHMNFGGLKAMASRRMVKGLPSMNQPDQLCEGCLLGSPQQNEVVERKSRTILNMARGMMKTKKMLREFWAEAVKCAVYLLNCCTTKAIDNKTLIELWSGRKPSVHHLKVFGSIAFAHIHDEKRTKLDDKCKKYVFVGYDSRTKGYRLYDPNGNKAMINEDDEDERQKIITPPASPTCGENASLEGSSREGPLQTRRRSDIYRETEEIEGTNAVTLLCLFADSKPIHFNKATKDTKWRRAMDEEMNEIKKNDTWELVNLPQGHATIKVKTGVQREEEFQRRSGNI